MKLYRYRIALTSPLQLGAVKITHREGVLLQLDGRWADAAPLPGFSRETLDDVRQQLALGESSTLPSLRFAQDALQAPKQLPVTVSVNALLQRSADEILAKASKLSVSGCEAIKLKVGRQAWQADADLVRRVREQLREDQRLRLDANRAWDLATAKRFAAEIRGCDIEYIEEPLRDASQLEMLFAATELPYALDETLADRLSVDLFNPRINEVSDSSSDAFSPHELAPDAFDLTDFPNVVALVVKPTILGGRDVIACLAATGKRLVLSACYESGVGIANIARLAAEYAPGVPVGLDTYAWLAEDVLAERLQFVDWRVHVPADLQVEGTRLLELE